MPSKLKRMTFVVTPEMEPLLDGIKKEMFYNCSQSEMIRTLVDAGLSAIQNEKQRAKTKHSPEYKMDFVFEKEETEEEALEATMA